MFDRELATGAGGVPIKAGEETIGGIAAAGAPGGDKDEACGPGRRRQDQGPAAVARPSRVGWAKAQRASARSPCPRGRARVGTALLSTYGASRAYGPRLCPPYENAGLLTKRQRGIMCEEMG
jgi:hypothetical protein